MREHGLSRRLAVRIAALAAQGLAISATVCEVARSAAAADAEGVAVAEFLMRPETLAHTSRPGQLAALLPPELVLAQDPGGQPVVALLEEAIAARARPRDLARTPSRDPAAAGALAAPLLQAMAPVTVPEREMPELLRALRTASSPSRQVEALRLLVECSPLDPESRAALVLESLASQEPEVARAAIALLGGAGLDRALVAALAELEHEEAAVRAHAVDRLRRAVGTPEALQAPLLLAACLVSARRALDAEREPSLVRDLALLLAEATRGPVASQANIDEVLRALVRCLLRSPASVALAMRRAVLRLGAVAPEATADALWREAEAVNDDVLAVCVLALAGELPLEELDEAAGLDPAAGRAAQFARNLLDRALAIEGAPALAQIEAGLRRRGDLGLDLVAGALARVPDQEAVDLVVVLDRLAAGVTISPAARARARRALIGQLERSGPPARIAILGSRLLATALDREEAGRIARELVTRIELYRLPDVWMETLEFAAWLGAGALDAIALVLEGGAPDRLERGHLIELLGASFSATGRAARYRSSERRLALDLLVAEVEAVSSHGVGAHAITAAEAAGTLLAARSTPYAEAKRGIRRFLAACEGEDGAVVAAGDHLRSLIVGRADLDDDLRAECEAAFRAALEAESAGSASLLSHEAAEERPWTGRVYVATGLDLLYTVRVPAAIRGLAALVASASSVRERNRRYRELLEHWPMVRDGESGWDPFNATALGRALAELAASESSSPWMRGAFLDRIASGADLLLPDERELPVVRATATVLAACGAALQRRHGLPALERLLRARRDALAFEAEERQQLLEAITTIAALPGLHAGDEEDGRRLALQALQHTRMALRNQLPGASEIARRLLGCRYLEPAHRAELEIEIARAVALQPAD